MEPTDKEFRKKLHCASWTLTNAQLDWILSGEWRKGANTLYGKVYLEKEKKMTKDLGFITKFQDIKMNETKNLEGEIQ